MDMAKLTVEYRCGHEIQEVWFGGKYSEQLEYAKDHLDCPDCYRAAQTAATQQNSDRMGLPALSGSEKQVKWANDIRFTILDDLKDIMHPEQDPRHEKLWAALLGKTEARWWIDRRDDSWKDVSMEVAKAEGLIA
jgi:hypothetical protein